MLARIRYRCIIPLVTVSILLVCYFFITSSYFTTGGLDLYYNGTLYSSLTGQDNNIWIIFTKVYEGSPLKNKYANLIANIMNVSSVPLSFNIIVDETSRSLAEDIIVKQMEKFNKSIIFNFYDIDYCAKLVDDIVGVMSKFFSKPGSYYSDVLFFISLGLHRIAPKTQKRAILLDCDLYFKEDVALIFDEFKKFKSTALFGLAPELSPVYRHVLRHYRAKHNTTTFGDYYHWNKTRAPNAPHSNGFQGYNSGVVLFNLEAIRNSEEFTLLLIKESLENLTEKYDFKQGHLGDQDFYTLIGCEYPHLIQTLNCGFNRQLCEWWKNNGYRDVFHLYAHCNQKIVIVHGNCNTEIPK